MAPVIDGGGTVTQAGTGTAKLNSANTYIGGTIINSGVLAVDTLANGGTASGIGAASNSAGNLIIGSGTLRYTGSGGSTDRLFSTGQVITSDGTQNLPVTPQIESSGTGPIAFTNTNPIGFDAVGVPRVVVLGGTNNGLNIFAAQITTNAGAGVGFFKTGSGTWKLTNTANNYTGHTYVYGGTLLATSLSSFGTTGNVHLSAPSATVRFRRTAEQRGPEHRPD